MTYNTILISGASSGIGAELARRFAKQGKTLGLMALPTDDLNVIQQEALALGAAEAIIFPVNVCERDAVRQAVADFAQQAGRIDLWVACAGIDVDVPLCKSSGKFKKSAHTFNEDDSKRIETLYDVNVNGLIYSTNAVLEQMLTQNKQAPKTVFSRLRKLVGTQPKGAGHIVGMASLAGWHIYPTHADYSATKMAVCAYLESIRVRLANSPITVTTVSPGFVRTPMTADHEHPMPFLVSAEQAADEIMRGIDNKQEHIAFPKPLVMATMLVKHLPRPLRKGITKLVLLTQ